MSTLNQTFREMKVHHDLMAKHHQSVTGACVSMDGASETVMRPVQEKMALYKISADAVMNVGASNSVTLSTDCTSILI